MKRSATRVLCFALLGIISNSCNGSQTVSRYHTTIPELLPYSIRSPVSGRSTLFHHPSNSLPFLFSLPTNIFSKLQAARSIPAIFSAQAPVRECAPPATWCLVPLSARIAPHGPPVAFQMPAGTNLPAAFTHCTIHSQQPFITPQLHSAVAALDQSLVIQQARKAADSNQSSSLQRAHTLAVPRARTCRRTLGAAARHSSVTLRLRRRSAMLRRRLCGAGSLGDRKTDGV
jgi:hypothetical protein